MNRVCDRRMDREINGRTERSCGCAGGYTGCCAYVHLLVLSTRGASDPAVQLALRPVKYRARQCPLNPLAQLENVLHLADTQPARPEGKTLRLDLLLTKPLTSG